MEKFGYFGYFILKSIMWHKKKYYVAQMKVLCGTNLKSQKIDFQVFKNIKSSLSKFSKDFYSF